MAFMASIAGDGAAAFLAFFIAFMAFGMVMNGKGRDLRKLQPLADQMKLSIAKSTAQHITR